MIILKLHAFNLLRKLTIGGHISKEWLILSGHFKSIDSVNIYNPTIDYYIYIVMSFVKGI